MTCMEQADHDLRYPLAVALLDVSAALYQFTDDCINRLDVQSSS